MDADQRQALVKVFIDEWESVPAPKTPEGGGDAEHAKRMLTWIDDLDRRIRERAASALSSQQVKVIAQEQRLQSANRWASFEMQKQARAAGVGMGAWYYPMD